MRPSGKKKLGVGIALPFLALAGVPVPRHPGRELHRCLLSFLPLLLLLRSCIGLGRRQGLAAEEAFQYIF